MSDTTTVHDQYYEMANAPVNRIIPKLAVPTIISMLVTSIYNMADTFFVSQLGTSASGAIGIVFSAMAIIQALSFMVGMGSGNYIARSIGAGKRQLAEQVASVAFFTGLIIGLLIAVLGNLSLRNVVFFLGATETIAPFAQDYARYIFLAAPFMVTSFIMNNLLRFQGKALFAMVGITTGGILNMILDPIFIFGLNLGISGAALATAFSQCISFGILFFQSLLRKDCVHLKPGKITLSLSLYGEILHGGIPSLCRQGVASIATAALNVAANPFGDAAIAALSIVSRYMMFIGSAMIGFGQGFQPVCGFNFGAKRYDRVLEAFWFCVKVAVVFLVTLSIVSFVGAPQIMRIFRKEDLDVIEIGTWALRFQCVTLPLSAWIVMSNMMTQTIGYGFRASLVAAGRQGLFLIPALFVLPVKFGIRGLQLCQPVADALTFVLGVVIVLGILRELKEKQEQPE